MGHDICGFNKAGEEIAYARFCMGNYNAFVLYDLLDANEYFAGVSGKGDSKKISIGQLQKAMDRYHKLCNKSAKVNNEAQNWDQKQIEDFIQNCLEAAQKEDCVRVYFG